MEIKNYADLKQFCNGLDEKFLKEPVLVIIGDGDGDTVKIDAADGLEEDYYQTDEGYCPESTFDQEQLDDEPLSERNKKDKGTPRLWTKF